MQALSQTTANPNVHDVIAKINQQYEGLCLSSKQLLQKYETTVGDHQQYQDMLEDCRECVSVVQDKASTCTDTSGDRHTLQIRYDRLKVSKYLSCFASGNKSFT